MASSMVIARLLTPDQIGVFSVTMVLLAFLATVRDLGAGEYLVQEKELTVSRIRAVWAVQLGLGLILAIIVLFAAFPVAAFYEEPEMAYIMLVISANYVINPFGSLTYAYLIREMRFDSIALIRFTGTFVGTIVSIALAMLDYGPISLAYGMFATTAVSATTAVYFRPKSFPWMPGLSDIRRVLSFGSKLTSTQLLNVLNTNFPELLLGKLQGMLAVGLYSRSSGLIGMFSRLVADPINSVALSWFSKQKREQGNFSEAFLKATSYVSVLGWTFSLALIFLAHPITRILYGPQWDASVETTQILAIGLIFTTPIGLSAIAQMAAGQATRLLIGAVITSAVTLTCTAIGANLGLNMLAWSVTLAAAISAPLWFLIARKTVGFQWLKLFQTLIKSSVVAMISAIAPVAVYISFGRTPENNIQALSLGCTGSFLGFILGLIIMQHPLRNELLPVMNKLRFR